MYDVSMSVEYRQIGTNVLSEYLNIETNVKILETRIFMSSSSQQDYFKKIYECVGYLTQGWVGEYHSDIKAGNSGFDLNAFWEYIKGQEETDRFLCEEVDIVEGALTCSKCKSSKVFSYTKQVRSADEGTSVFARCYNCSHKWRES
jgi:DNA-directed RNA polymerase subunit M/transcription elongation factor TFIIS